MKQTIEIKLSFKSLTMNLEENCLAIFQDLSGVKEHAVALLFEALRCKTEGRGFGSRRGHRDFSCDLTPSTHYLREMSTRGGKNGRYVGGDNLATFMC